MSCLNACDSIICVARVFFYVKLIAINTDNYNVGYCVMFFSIYMVPKTGVEPVRYCYRWILSPVRLPIPPLRHLIYALSIVTLFYNYVNAQCRCSKSYSVNI